MRQPDARPWRWLRNAVFLLSLWPAVSLMLRAFQDRLGANPLETLTRASGDWALYFLCITLAVTPLRRLLSLPGLIRLRRMLGLFTFFYACLHALTFIWFDHFFDWHEAFADVLKRPFITLGFFAFIALVPLALTSPTPVMRWMGRRWGQLHRLIYLIAILAVAHFSWMRAGKNQLSEPLLFAALVAGLLGVRLLFRWRGRVQ